MIKMQEITNLSVEELHQRLAQAQQEYVAWRENILTGKEDNYAALRNLKRDIARLKTIIHQRARQG